MLNKNLAIRGHSISVGDFIQAWQSSDSIYEVQRKLNLESADDVSNSDISSRASQLRHRGVALKRMAGGQRYDYRALNDFAEWILEQVAAGREASEITQTTYRAEQRGKRKGQ